MSSFVAGKCTAASLRDIEILTPRRDAQAAAGRQGIKEVLVSLGHSDVRINCANCKWLDWDLPAV